MIKKIAVLFVGISLSVSMVSPGFASDTPSHGAEDGGPFHKLGRGLVNIILSPAEILTNYKKSADDHGAFAGSFEGVLKGFYYMGGRIITGAMDVVTFPLACPKTGYGPHMKPEYVTDALNEVFP